MEKLKLTDITKQMVELLEPFESDERQKIVQASMTLLGDNFVTQKTVKETINESIDGKENLSEQAKIWMKQNQISSEHLQNVFHIAEGKAEVIVSEILGNDGKSKTINAYILQGVASCVMSGDSKFDDKSARALCIKLGCYSLGNHALYIKGIGNKATGSKDSGWTLTGPGLKYAAQLIKELGQSL
jgi:hypothetical protein